MGRKADQSSESRSEWKTAILVVVLVLIVQAVVGIAVVFALDGWPARAAFGDMFGVVNTTFSGFALAGVVYAILLQRHELSLQREELSMTREELRRTADAQQAATKYRQEELALIKKRYADEEGKRASEVAPDLSLRSIEETEEGFVLHLENHGGSMTQATVTSAAPGTKARIEPSGGILRDSGGDFVITVVDDTHRLLSMTVSFKDERQQSRTVRLNCDPWREQFAVELLPEDDCYLTSACVEHAGLPDDCWELAVMREFRDEYLMASVPGVAMVHGYYRDAPRILEAIRSSGANENVMPWILSRVRVTVGHYEAGRRADAVTAYIDLIRTMERQFLELGTDPWT